jgi:hypothetical protein
MDARTVAAFRDLSLMVESLADQIGDPEMQAMRRDRAARIVPADLAPRPIIR